MSVFKLDALCSLAGCFVFCQTENPAVELKKLKSLLKKENCKFLLPARKAVGLHLQVTCQRFKKEKLDFILFFLPGFKMVRAGMKNGSFLRGALSALSSKKEQP